jgi:hypothetical protein
MAGRERSRPVFFARGNGVGGSADDPICGAAEAIRPGARQAGMPAPRSSRAWTIIQRRERLAPEWGRHSCLSAEQLAPGVGQTFLLVRGAARPRSGAGILACPRSGSPPEWGRHSCLSAEQLAPGVGQTFLLVRGAARPRSGADILACPRSGSPPEWGRHSCLSAEQLAPEWGRHSCLSAEQLAPGVGQAFLLVRGAARPRSGADILVCPLENPPTTARRAPMALQTAVFKPNGRQECLPHGLRAGGRGL